MNKTAIYFTIKPTSTVHFTTFKTVAKRECGNRSHQIFVFFVATINETKLFLIVNFKA